MRFLITGGAGYVGSHCAKALHAAGHGCVVFDNLTSGHADFVKWGPLVEGDIRSKSDLHKAFRDFRFDAVLHFAGLSSVAESMDFPERYQRNNIEGTRLLLDAMLDAGVRALVFSSSCAIYGAPTAIPITEGTETNPINPYGASKARCEEMMRELATDAGLEFVALRYFNAAGADPDGKIGEDHERESRLIPIALDAVSGRRPYINLFGTEYDTPDGTAIRDYIHVTDLAAAHVAALQYLLKGGASVSLNLGTNIGHSVRRVLETVEQVTGLKLPVRICAARPGDPPVLVADASAAARVLGWTPVRSELSRMIADAWAWHRRRFRSGVTLPTE